MAVYRLTAGSFDFPFPEEATADNDWRSAVDCDPERLPNADSQSH